MRYLVPAGIGTVLPVRERKPIDGWMGGLIRSYRHTAS